MTRSHETMPPPEIAAQIAQRVRDAWPGPDALHDAWDAAAGNDLEVLADLHLDDVEVVDIAPLDPADRFTVVARFRLTLSGQDTQCSLTKGEDLPGDVTVTEVDGVEVGPDDQPYQNVSLTAERIGRFPLVVGRPAHIGWTPSTSEVTDTSH